MIVLILVLVRCGRRDRERGAVSRSGFGQHADSRQRTTHAMNESSTHVLAFSWDGCMREFLIGFWRLIDCRFRPVTALAAGGKATDDFTGNQSKQVIQMSPNPVVLVVGIW